MTTLQVSDRSRVGDFSQEKRRASPVVWLNLFCLDAPLVSIAWLWLFARVFHESIAPANCAALFLTAWLIYLVDRLADCRSLPASAPRSLRHAFCLRHQRAWIGLVIIIAVVDAILILKGIDRAVMTAGAVIGGLAVIHLLLNFLLGGAWPSLPLKEVTIGLLFAMGTLVPIYPVETGLSVSLIVSATAFAVVCALNCICIAFWERQLDEAQGKVSFATRLPGLNAFLIPILLVVGISAMVGAIVWRDVAPVLECISLSALLLAGLDFSREKIHRDQRTALADLVLLTPLLVGVLISR